MYKSFNAFGSGNKPFGLSEPVWLGTVSPVPAGGTVASEYCGKGIHYPAGTPINIENRVITPYIALKVTAVSEGVITVDTGLYNITPKTSDFVGTVGATFSADGEPVAITAVKQHTDNSNLYDLTTASDAKTGSVVVLVHSEAKAKAPNAYLYNDIKFGYEDTVSASGAAVMFHGEGILVDRTPAADIKAQMKAAVPGVYQHNG